MTLDQIALKHGTDKASNIHNYTPHYERFFGPYRYDRLTLFECGFGGYHFPDRGGAGARTWRDYFPHAIIVSTDKYPKNVKENFWFEQGDQDDVVFWDTIILKHGNPNIFIDDASHINPLSIATFEIMFPKLKPGGIYCWEDLESSHWQAVATDGTDFKGCQDYNNLEAPTALNFLRRLTIDVNSKHIHQHTAKYPIDSITFCDNIAFIVKKK